MYDILNWMKEFLIIYLILTILTHLAASDQYKKYLRFFAGIILLLTLVTPALGLFGKDGELEALISYETFWEELDSIRQDAGKLEFLQDSSDSYIRKYERAIAQDIKYQALQQDIPVSQVQVSLADDHAVRHVTVQIDITGGMEVSDAAEKLTGFLKRAYGLEPDQVSVR